MYAKGNLSERIADNIIQSIQTGFYKKGQQIPSEVELGLELGVSRATVREAIKLLISKGYLEVRRGIGTFISETPGLRHGKMEISSENLEASATDVFRLMKWLHKDILDHVTAVNHDVIIAWMTQCEESKQPLDSSVIMTLMMNLSSHMERIFFRNILDLVHQSAKLLMHERIQINPDELKINLLKFASAIIYEPSQAVILHHAMIDAWLIEMREGQDGLI